ncbi:cupredoxin domain-containing protein [Lactococcus fujiensis]|uniref:EfeO-type cupredoxin-like domain-containing protein n=1 Tax=Lactococcus fujiensis JCM 16395 TaxID=1291764 RepID=A0A2A5RKX9_9LACT|nr:cupredoxin domain-containing protein [Lactococcus fujiensis]PCR99847.1 hypothetical protein RT41_GL001653 [Lactococcus fujiensis JCM 16395]
MFNKNKTQEITVIVDGSYEPSNFKLKADRPAKVTFIRKSDKGCLDQIIFNGETRDLPLNEAETFQFTPQTKGDIEWSCGMNMVKGKYTVK